MHGLLCIRVSLGSRCRVRTWKGVGTWQVWVQRALPECLESCRAGPEGAPSPPPQQLTYASLVFLISGSQTFCP